MSKATLSCCLVIKNEEKIILHCLNHILFLADELVIIDTGSTDSTHSLIEGWILEKKCAYAVKFMKVGSKFHDEDGDFHFGKAKSFALSQGTKDFVMWMDASDIVTDDKAMKNFFLQVTNETRDVYFSIPTATSKSHAFPRARIGPRDGSWMTGRVHEYLIVRTGLQKVFIPIPINNVRNAPSQERNIRLLLKDWKDNPSPRNAFYLGDSYRENRDRENALKWFKMRAFDFPDDNSFPEEQFKAMEMAAEQVFYFVRNGEMDPTELSRIADNMISVDPQRMEGHYYKGQYFMILQEWKKAIQSLSMYSHCKRPKEVKLWLDQRIYVARTFIRDIEKCETAIKYAHVRIPDQVFDLPGPGGIGGSMKHGNDQY